MANWTGWILEFTKLKRLEQKSITASNALGDWVRASGKAWVEFLDEFEDVLEDYRSGPHQFVTGGNPQRFPEVREINDRISSSVEAVLE